MIEKIMLRSLAAALLLIVLSPLATMGQYTYGDWARDHGCSLGDVMPYEVDTRDNLPPFNNLAGIGDYDWTTTPTRMLCLEDNEISNIISSDFNSDSTHSGVTKYGGLRLNGIEASNIHRFWTSAVSSGVTARGFQNFCFAWKTLQNLPRPISCAAARRPGLPNNPENYCIILS